MALWISLIIRLRLLFPVFIMHRYWGQKNKYLFFLFILRQLVYNVEYENMHPVFW